MMTYYIARINPDCQALAWKLIEHYRQGKELQSSDTSIILNPYLASKIERISLSDLAKYQPDSFRNKIGLVGVDTDRSSPVIIQAIAIDTLIRSIDNHQPLLIQIDQTIGIIYILVWSGLNSLSIFQIRRLFSMTIGITLISIGSGELLFIFECSRDPQTRVYSTIIKYTSGKNKELIRWKSNAIENPKITCRNVSDRFDLGWDRHQLNHFKVGQSRRNGMTIVCGVAATNNVCNDDNKLFDLLPDNNKSVAKDLLQIINDKNSKTSPIWQNSGDEITINLRQWIVDSD
jgi:hypothetical protein